jgi:hypothetical protein
LDEESLLSEYDMARGDKSQSEPVKPEERIPAPPKWIPAVAVLVILLLAAGLFYAGRYGWRRYVAHRAAKQSAATDAPSQILSQASSSSSSPASADSSLDLSVSISAATHVRVLGDNKALLDGDLPAGETRHFFAHQQFEVTAGDSSAVLLELNGQAMPPLGAPGSSGTIVLSQKDLRQAPGGKSQP